MARIAIGKRNKAAGRGKTRRAAGLRALWAPLLVRALLVTERK
jgi:hypothetical protein